MNWRERLDTELPALTGDHARDEEIREELADYCATRCAELERGELTRGEAERRVLAEVADLARQAARRAVAVRVPTSRRGAGLLASWWRDLHYAARLLRRSPGFAAGAILTLALAVGAVTAVFSVVDGVLLQPLPYPDGSRLAYVWEVTPRGVDHNVVSRGVYSAWAGRAKSFSALGAVSTRGTGALTGSGEPFRVSMTAVTPSTFDVVRVVPVAGRGFGPDDGLPEGPRVVLIGERLWTSRFGADPNLVGREVVVDGTRLTVQGVLPDGPGIPELNGDVVVPLRFTDEDRVQFTSHNLRVVGRLAQGVTFSDAQVEMDALTAALAVEQPANLTDWGVNVAPMHRDLVRGVRPLLTLLMAVVVVVLLMACANLANLQLARASGRGRELAVRSAIGAGRRRLVGQLLTESFVLAGLGGLAGAALAWWLTQALVGLAPGDIPLISDVAFDWRALGAALVVTAGCAILVGAVPAFQVSRTNLQPLLHGGRIQSDPRQGRLRLVLVATQVAMAFVLLVAAALLTRSFANLNAVDHGFDPDRLLTVELNLPGARYPDAESASLFYGQLLSRLREAPGIERVASTSAYAGDGAGMTFSYGIEGRIAPNPNGREDDQPLQAVAPGYFETMAIPVIEGRSFEATDGARGLPVVVINEALAKLHWAAGESPIGSRLSARPGQTPWLEVVGVVGDTRDEGLDRPAPPTLYLPYEQAVAVWDWLMWQNLVIRTAARPEAAVGAVSSAVWSLDSELPLLDTRSMNSAFAENAARRRFAMQMLAGFAVLALLLGAIGIYGVLSYSVTERRQEIGVRLALGAKPGQVAGAVLRPVLIVAAAGVALGLVASLSGASLLESLLFGVDSRDPGSYVLVSVGLCVMALVAAWRPLRQAARLDPLVVLRES